jgi:hypothetical protein
MVSSPPVLQVVVFLEPGDAKFTGRSRDAISASENLCRPQGLLSTCCGWLSGTVRRPMQVNDNGQMIPHNGLEILLDTDVLAVGGVRRFRGARVSRNIPVHWEPL